MARPLAPLAQICAKISTDLGEEERVAETARFTVGDVCSALDVKKHDVRAWLRLPPYGDAEVTARSARRFTQVELVFFALIAQLHIGLGMSPTAIRKCSAALHTLITSRLDGQKLIFVNVTRGTATYLGATAPNESGAVVAVAPVIELVHKYLLGELSGFGSANRNVLPLDRRKKA